MGLTEKIKNFVAPEDDEEEIELSQEEAKSLSQYEDPQTNINPNTNIVLFEPRHFEEAEEIGKYLKSNKACCINLHRMPSEYRQRTIDFLSGLIFGINGSINKIGENVILCSPKNLQVAGDINLNYED